MKKPVFLLVFLLFYPQFASAYTNFSYLNLGGVRYSYLSSNEYTDYHVIPTEPVIHDEKDEDGGLKNCVQYSSRSFTRCQQLYV
jgi:hypothetical protein